MTQPVSIFGNLGGAWSGLRRERASRFQTAAAG
jgi:hypothetical protein